ncbi:MAG: hypothetical protein CL608_27660 [Anaerolineaceae bacterium]|nr:hypothetical protein [Anaerolineaceae bacterium]
MVKNATIALYKKQYVDIQFERAGLFKLIREKYGATEVLYPGSSVHITPSFYFPHVVYVDSSPTAVDFFANETAVLAYINRKKTYKRSAYIRFIAQNYAEDLPEPEASFDLLLALFAPNVVPTCQKHLKKDGILVTNNFQDEALVAAATPTLTPISMVQYQKKAYALVEDTPEKWLNAANAGKTKRYLQQASAGYEYVEAEQYFLFKKQAN